MARPKKIGLDYFPLDVDIFDDEKISAISGEFGLKGEIVVIKLLCAIYRNGYFIVWNKLTQMKLAKDLQGVTPDLLNEIVNRLVAYEFFNEGLFNSMDKILTSVGIQERYFDAIKRRDVKEVDFPYLLQKTPLSRVNVNINPTTEVFLSAETTQSKGKESKGNKSKEKDSVCVADTTAHTHEVSSYFLTLIQSYAPAFATKQWVEPLTFKQEQLLISTYSRSQICEALGQLHNKIDTITGRSAYYTLDGFLKNLRQPRKVAQKEGEVGEMTYKQLQEFVHRGGSMDGWYKQPDGLWRKQ